MLEPSPRFWEIFFEVYGALPRQGPGNRACAARALSLCRDLPPSPAVLDLGCGAGGQTLHLAELLDGSIMAIDTHTPGIELLKKKITARGLDQRIQARVGDMSDLQLPPRSFDLIWSEGALYNIGIAAALKLCHDLLRPNGYLAFTDAVWREDNPPAEVRAGFELDYPAMGDTDQLITTIQAAGFELIGHFTLPDEAWWEDFYTPMEERIKELRHVYSHDPQALAILDQIGEEPALHRHHSRCYAYEFFVVRRPGTTDLLSTDWTDGIG
ncbi:class I SAM-dependent methyltransferase [Desulfobulbus alkaliphilus]|uniref:class I SAM-dependent methyltransferase n=1 Tax=Desulfobulbus alkaliphilus TaxID=869814 RepID=UPI00196626A4|nr:class I SAM-dependent methyltransferase [Desulfobulbus alkaliphilus]MBM9535711.1 class I SAM-dependent methyltransferase [Desulfobulbus alkaliphilus]